MATPKNPNKTTASQLIRMTAKTSKYNLYEVQDIVNHFLGHIQAIFAKKMYQEVQLDGIGTLKHVVKKPRVFFSGLMQKEMGGYNPSHMIALAMSDEMLRLLRESHNEQYIRDNGTSTSEPEGSTKSSTNTT